MAKDFLVRHMRLCVGGYDLSGDSRAFSEAANAFNPIEIGGWNEPVKNYIPGTRSVGLMGYQAILNDAAGRSFAVLQAAENSNRLSLLFGSGDAPAVNDPAYLLASVQMNDQASFASEIGVLTADFLPDASQAPDYEPFGKVLLPETALSATGNGTSVDNLASSANGAHANLHILVSSGGTWALIIEHSVDNAAWATLITFTSDGSAVASEHGTASGTVNRYTRFTYTRTSGTLTAVVTLARN